VERGPWLEVIDTRASRSPPTGQTVLASIARHDLGVGLAAGPSFTTMRRYDAKARRKIQLDAAGAATFDRGRLIAFAAR